MTWIAGGALAVIVILAWMLYGQQHAHSTQLQVFSNAARLEREEILARAQKERASLLDRVQHPQYFQPGQISPPSEPPRDAMEMAYVGQLVPEFAHVGDPDAMEYIGQEVPDDVNIEGAQGE